MKLNQNQSERLARLITESLLASGLIQARDEAEAGKTGLAVILGDLKKEEEIEKEAEALIKKHSAAFHSGELNFELLLKRAKHELAKKKGFKL